jgi:hypothetical protein
MMKLENAMTLGAVMLLAACASGNSREPRQLSASDTCAPNETLVCEVSNTGRIKHGSFSKEGERCACSDRRKGAPLIPGIP